MFLWQSGWVVKQETGRLGLNTILKGSSSPLDSSASKVCWGWSGEWVGKQGYFRNVMNIYLKGDWDFSDYLPRLWVSEFVERGKLSLGMDWLYPVLFPLVSLLDKSDRILIFNSLLHHFWLLTHPLLANWISKVIFWKWGSSTTKKKDKGRGLEGPEVKTLRSWVVGNAGWSGSTSLLSLVHISDRGRKLASLGSGAHILARGGRASKLAWHLPASDGGVPPKQNQGAITRQRRKEARVDKNDKCLLLCSTMHQASCEEDERHK